MAVSKKIRRLNPRQAETHRNQLREDQSLRDQFRRERLYKTQRGRNRIEGVEGLVALLLIIGFFALIYWLAISESLPAAF